MTKEKVVAEALQNVVHNQQKELGIEVDSCNYYLTSIMDFRKNSALIDSAHWMLHGDAPWIFKGLKLQFGLDGRVQSQTPVVEWRK